VQCGFTEKNQLFTNDGTIGKIARSRLISSSDFLLYWLVKQAAFKRMDIPRFKAARHT
jgi:hypothetical protein